MVRLARWAGAAMLVAGSTLSAQQPMRAQAGPGGGGMGPMAGASFLLSHTGELQLTDQQVVRLAGIARREGSRRKAMMDTMMRNGGAMAMRRDTAGPRRPDPQMMARMTQARDQMRNDLKEAITVLTPDQQAQAWTMVAGRGGKRRMGGGARGGAAAGMMDRQGGQREGRRGGMRPGGGAGAGAGAGAGGVRPNGLGPARGRVGRPGRPVE
ncbi:MAG: Spy/CpxP family protein refolding chaperone [Gemmatimonadaceae bacterium]